MNLIAVPPDKAAEAWPLAEKYISAIADKTGFVETEDVRRQVLTVDALLWLAADGVKVVGSGATRLIEHRGKRICEIFAWGADDQKKCAPLLKVIEGYAKQEGCASVRFLGRKGWARQLPDYRITAIILEKELP